MLYRAAAIYLGRNLHHHSSAEALITEKLSHDKTL